MRKPFNVTTIAAAALCLAMSAGVGATSAPNVGAGLAPVQMSVVPSVTVAAGHPQSLRSECTPEGTCYIYDDKGHLIAVIG